MAQEHQTRKSGSYTANLLGNIRSHLAGLQGYDVMALELIQNADDAGAEEVIFDVTDRGLLVANSGRFTYCGDLHTRPCGFIASNSDSCDYHRIADVGSGGKLARGENIGRFGIGFVSTYQITDHPEIRSSGIKLSLHPEEGRWFIENFDQPDGTTFFLPWADDPNTEARLALGVSHISSVHVDQLTEDFQGVLRKSLLFLRHVRKAEVRRNGKLLLACDLDRGDGSDLIVSFRPGGEVEQWHILRADAAESAAQLYAAHPRLESFDRGTKISIGLRLDPEPLAEGLLYAFLPTEQLTGLPLHINADFFPESDRKAVIFAGHQHEQAWNEMLVDAAAAELARDPEGLLKMLGNVQLWQILGRALDLSRQSNHPACFNRFWDRIKATANQARIALAQDGSVQCPNGVFFADKTLSAFQVKALQEIGGKVVVEELRPFRTAINQLGAPILTLERLVGLLEHAMSQQVPGEVQVSEERLETFFLPLWSMVNDLLPETGAQIPGTNPVIQRLLAVPFVVTEDLFAVTIHQTYSPSASLDAGRVAALLPRLAIASHHLLGFPKVARLIRHLDLDAVVSHISSSSTSDPVEDIIGVERKELLDLYTLFSDLDRQGNVEHSVYQSLKHLPIWLSSRGLVKATEALLPGNFNDPTGLADLLETSVLTGSARDFVSVKLGVHTQTVEAFVQNVLPRFFNEDGPVEEQKYARLITELANHTTLVNDENIRQLLGSLPIVPTQDGRWSRPTNIYRRTDDLVKVLGDTMHLWLDASRVPNTRSVNTFIDSLAIHRSPTPRHLVDRMLFIAKKHLPTEDAKRASSDAFYVLCDNYEEWKDKKSFREAIADLRGVECFPAIGDGENWYSAELLYAPFRAEAFDSQASILDFRSMARLSRELLGELNISLEPETQLVIDHLRSCVKRNVQAPFTTYQILNERTRDENSQIASLSGEPFIYIDSQKAYVRSNQLFWMPQQLSRYAFTIPGNLESFKPLFTEIGVKNSPEGREFVDILLDIVGSCFEQSTPVTGPDRAVYEVCLAGISSADEREELSASDLRRLQEAPTILNLMSQPTHPDEVLLQDSEWHAGFFGGGLDRALCKPVPELWSFVEKTGVRRLSESAKVALEFVDGPRSEEFSFAEKLMERKDILARLLHDKPTTVKRKIRTALSELKAVSYELVRIQASVNVGGDQVSAPPGPAHAFYDIEKRQLIVARPVGDRSWPHVLNAIFHQLMPEESGSEISKLTLSVRPLMGMSIEDAHRELTDAGIPYLDAEVGGGQAEDLTSPDLGEMGSTAESFGPEDGESVSAPTERTVIGDRTSESTGARWATGESQVRTSEETSSGQDQRGAQPSGAQNEDAEGNNSPKNDSDDMSTARGERRARELRPKHKEQWDRRLLSYVRQKQHEGSVETDDQESPSEHNLAVEAIARSEVCAYEKRHGRIPGQMAQTHPGYDIISRNPLTGEERYIEVKGVNGSWNQTGVGLSRLQFSNAQDFGDRYWLYVVEMISDSQAVRVHPICSPASQVTSFMFDGNWRAAVADEPSDPSLAFIAGVKVKHQFYGFGRIESVELKGTTRVMSIRFETTGLRKVTLNLNTITVVGEEEDSRT